MVKSASSEATFDPALIGVSAAGALDAITQAGERAVALVEAWVRAGNAAAVAAIAEHGSGPARKAARRGLQVLGARGIKVEAAPRVVKLAPVSGELVTEAWLIAPDPNGIVSIVIATRSPTGRTRSGFFYLRSGYGLEEVSIGELSGGKLKEALKRASALGLEPAPISPGYARQRISEERKRHAELGLPEPLGMVSAGPLLEPLPETPEPHPLDAEGLELSDDDASELAKRSAALHQLPEFRAWLPDRDVVREMLAEVGRQIAPDQVDDAERVSQVMTAAIQAAADRYFSPERRAALVGLMKDSALSVLTAHGEVRALEVVAAMKSIEACGLITNPPHEVPFLRAFFEKAVLTLAAQSGGRLSLPVPPGAPGAVPEETPAAQPAPAAGPA